MFTIEFNDKYGVVVLRFKNEVLEIMCRPENIGDICEKGYDSSPSNGEFMFSYDEENISFRVAKYGNGQGGDIYIRFKMTKEIRESLEHSMKEWRNFIEHMKLMESDDEEEGN